MSSPGRDHRLLASGRPRAASRSSSGPVSRSSFDLAGISATPLGSSATRSSSSSLHTPPQSQPFQPRIVRGTVAPSPASTLNAAGPSRPNARTRRGSATATVLGVSPAATPVGTGSPGSRHNHSASLGSTSVLHQHLKATSLSAGVPGSPSSSHASGSGSGVYSDGTLLSFPRPAYVEQSALRRYIDISPYIPSPSVTGHHPHGRTEHVPAGSRSSRDRNSRSSFSNSQGAHPMHMQGGSYVGTPSVHQRRSMHEPESEDESGGSEGDSRTPQIIRRRATNAATNVGNGATPTTSPAVVDDVLQFPTRWNAEDRSGLLSISPDGREVHLSGPLNSSDKDASAVRTNFAMPRACGIYYFEIEILNRGQKGEIGIGFGSKLVSLTRLPGWAQADWPSERPRESWGYHGDDGNSFASHDQGVPYGPRFTTTDIVGCGIDFSLNRAFYTKNGAFLGHVFENIDGELYPMVGLRTAGEAIRANFGQQPFKYDIDSYAHLQRNAVWSKIQSLPITWSPPTLAFQATTDATNSNAASKNEDETREAMDKIVMDYLSHHGYSGAAEAFRLSLAARSSASESNAAALASSTNSMDIAVPSSESKQLAISSAADILARQRITTALLSGDVDYVLETMSDRYPDALTANGGWLLFRLRCRKFVELVLEAAAALKIARKVEAAEAASRDKGKAPSVPTPPPTASVPIRRAPTHHVHPSDVFEEEEDGDPHENGNVMDVDEDEDAADHRAVQEQLAQTPSSSPHPASHFPTPATTPAKKVQYISARRTVASPITISRPLIPISTASSSPSSTPPKSSPVSTSLAITSNGATSNGSTNTPHPLPMNATPNPKITPLFPLPVPPQPRGLITAPPPPKSSAAQAALEHIFAYGRQLDADYGADERAHVQTLFHRTSSLVAYENPLEAGGDVSRLAGQEAREELAIAVNEGILASQGRSSRPVLERIYEQTAATVVHLGLTGTGAAAYADLERELLKDE